MKDMDITILHVEDDLTLAALVERAFRRFGFNGSMLLADRVKHALDLLGQRARNRQRLDLILSDMQLPDGTGLDVVRVVKADPLWHLTPVILLSGETRSDIVNEAYALGANCYIPKSGRNAMESLRALYDCWVERALLPQAGAGDRAAECLARAIILRTRTSGVYLRLADLFSDKPDEMRFWLEMSLGEGNLSNLLALLRNKVGEGDFPSEKIEYLSKMQDQVEKSLVTVEKRLQGTAVPDFLQLCHWILDLTDTLDEEIFADSLGCLFPKSPVAVTALRDCAASRFNALAAHILELTDEPEIQQRAEALLKRAGRMAEARGESLGTPP